MLSRDISFNISFSDYEFRTRRTPSMASTTDRWNQRQTRLRLQVTWCLMCQQFQVNNSPFFLLPAENHDLVVVRQMSSAIVEIGAECLERSRAISGSRHNPIYYLILRKSYNWVVCLFRYTFVTNVGGVWCVFVLGESLRILSKFVMQLLAPSSSHS